VVLATGIPVLIDDYKSFVRIQLKRSNYLVALRAATSVPTSAPVTALIQVLTTEDDGTHRKRPNDGSP
jgi:hypothetical protein